MSEQIIEIRLNDKQYRISLEPFSESAKEEIKQFFQQNIDSLSLLKAYLTKTQEYAQITQHIEALHQNIEQSNVLNSTIISIES